MADITLHPSDLQAWEVEFESLDGIRLSGSQLVPWGARHTAVLVQGGLIDGAAGSAGDERAFFARLAFGLASCGIASLRFDLRAHGASGGRLEALTLAALVNDIRAAVEIAELNADGSAISLVGTSLWGGASALFAARYPERIRRLVLLHPLIDYKRVFIDEGFNWTADRITEEAAQELNELGFVAHTHAAKLGRSLLNEVFYLRPDEAIRQVVTPTLVVHGTADAVVSIECSRTFVGRIVGEAELLEIEGAGHGFAVPGDRRHSDPRTQRWQAAVVRSMADWIKRP